MKKTLRDSYVVGVGMTRFGVLPGSDVRSLSEEAIFAALKDAGAKPQDMEAAYAGSVGMAYETPMMIGQIACEQVGIKGIPVTRIENACASGANAFREAWIAIQSGLYDVVLVLGVEIMNAPSVEQVRLYGRLGGGDALMEGCMGFFPPGIFGMIAQKYISDGVITRSDLAKVAVKNSKHGSKNPKAQHQRPLTEEEVIKSRPVADPLGVLDCCPVSDGAAAVVLASKEAKGRFKGKAVRIKACTQVSGTYCEDDPSLDPDTTRRAAGMAYEMAGIAPGDLDIIECHDCFTMAELMHYRDLGLCKKEDIASFIREGKTAHGGKIPVNVSGGLLSKGHPLGATGPAQITEVVTQLRGDAAGRQVKGAKLGLTHNGGGFRHGDTGIVVVTVLEKS